MLTSRRARKNGGERASDMKHSQKAKYIVLTCMLFVGVFSAFILYKSFRPTRGLPYERLTMQQAVEYMEFEEGYVLLDVRSEQEFEKWHIPDAVNIPYDQLVAKAILYLPDFTQLIYVTAGSSKTSKKAAMKLCQLGYVNITEIGAAGKWENAKKQISENE